MENDEFKIAQFSQSINNEVTKIYNCCDILKEFFTKEEIKEAGEKMVACGCSVCRMRYLTAKFPYRVPKEQQLCWGA